MYCGLGLSRHNISLAYPLPPPPELMLFMDKFYWKIVTKILVHKSFISEATLSEATLSIIDV